MTSKIIYKGMLRTEAVHLKSGNTIISDAPTDNHGKGEAFSPTDLVATSLASCMLTIMGILASRLKIDITGTEATVNKIMQSNPRKIAAIQVTITLPHNNYSEKHRLMLERKARTCPVALSLAENLKQEIIFNYPDTQP